MRILKRTLRFLAFRCLALGYSIKRMVAGNVWTLEFPNSMLKHKKACRTRSALLLDVIACV